MNLASIGKKLLPHIIIMAIFLIVSCAVLSPILSGKVLAQHDVKMFSGSFEETKKFQEQSGERSLWTNSMFGGMPTYQIAPHSPNNMLGTAWIFNFLVSGNSLPKPINVLFLYCFSFYLLMLAFRVNPWLAMLGAFAFAFSSFNFVIIEAGHMLQAYSLATGPLVLAAAVFTIRFKKYFLGGALFALALALHLRTNHPQMSYYFGILIIIYLLSELIYSIKQKQLLPIIFSFIAIFVGFLLATGTYMTSYLTTNEYSKQSTRGPSELLKGTGQGEDPQKSSGLNIEYAFGYSYGVGETFSLLIPDIRGGNADALGNVHRDALKGADPQMREYVLSMDEYWGEDSGSGPYYFGAIICFLFVLGLIFLKSHDKWWILAVAIIGIMLSWGKNFMDFNEWVFYNVPLYNKFRSVNFTMFMAAVVVPILAVLGLSKVLVGLEWNKQTRQKLLIAFGCTGGLCLLFIVVPSLAGDFLKPNNMDARPLGKAPKQTVDMILSGLADARTELLRADAIRSFIFILLAGAMVWLYSMKWNFFAGKNGKTIVIAGITILILFDQVSVVKRYLTDKKFETKRTESYDPTEADNYILRDPDPDYRVINLSLDPNSAAAPFNDASTSYFHKSIGGYHGAKIRRFQELAEKYLYGESSILLQNVTKIPQQQLMPMLQQARKINILNMLDCKYIIASADTAGVIKNPYALGHAWFVKGIRPVQNADEELAALDGFNPADTAVIDEGAKHENFKTYMQGFSPVPDPAASIKLDVYHPNDLKYSTNAATEQFAVFSEVYYDNSLGWDVYVDGKQQSHVRVNYLLRGMRVPAGQHTIEFKFHPQSFEKGEKYAMISSLLMLAGLIGSAGFEIWRGRNKKDEEASVPEA